MQPKVINPPPGFTGTVCVEQNTDEMTTCNFCTDRSPAKFRLESNNIMRTMVVFVCEHCAAVLKEQIW